MTTILALGGANLAYAAIPTAPVFLAIAGALFLLSISTALQMRGAGNSAGHGMVVAATSAIAFGWACSIQFAPAQYWPGLPETALSAGALCFGLARRLRAYRHAWSDILRHAVYWGESDLAEYAEFLLLRRPCPDAAQIARELYRRASQRTVDRPWSPAPRTAIMRRYAELLQCGVGGAADPQAADWWTQTAEAADDDGYGVIASGRHDSSGLDTAAIEIIDDLPIWRIRLREVTAISSRKVAVAFHAFPLPRAGLVACAIRLSDDSEAPGAVHRIFDVSDPEVEAYLAALEHHLKWRIELFREGAGERPVRVLEVPLAGTGFMEALDTAIAHNAALGPDLDSKVALDFVASKLDGLSDDDGIEAAWAAIDAACSKVAE